MFGVAGVVIAYGPGYLPPSTLSTFAIWMFATACIIVALVSIGGEPKWGN